MYKKHLLRSHNFLTIALSFVLLSVAVSAQPKPAPLVLTTEPESAVWLDGVYYGKADDTGTFKIRRVRNGSRSIRVRADGFEEAVVALAPKVPATLDVKLKPTTDAATLAFQEAERLTAIDRPRAAEAYRNALKLRPNFPEANVGLARTLAEMGSIEGAFRAVNDALKQRPTYSEAAAVKGRLLKDTGEEAKAIAEFKRAITLGKGFQPEAHTGLGILYQERAEMKIAEDVPAAERDYEESAKYFAEAIKQLGTAPDAAIVYQLLGRILEHQRKYKEAITLYKEFLADFPDAVEAPAVRSFIVQLQKQLDEQ